MSHPAVMEAATRHLHEPDPASEHTAALTPRELMGKAMRREPTPRIPTMPQLCHDTPLRVFESEDQRDWIDGLKRCIEDPMVIYDYVIRLVDKVNCDGLRLFVKPEPMKVKRVGDDLIVLDPTTDQRLGRIDTLGGGGYVPDRPPPPVESLDDARVRFEAMVSEFTAEKMDLLRQARERVPSRFVASAPGGITMNTYTILRGRERAMMDFYDRPEFVRAVMDMQAEAIQKYLEGGRTGTSWRPVTWSPQRRRWRTSRPWSMSPWRACGWHSEHGGRNLDQDIPYVQTDAFLETIKTKYLVHAVTGQGAGQRSGRAMRQSRDTQRTGGLRFFGNTIQRREYGRARYWKRP